MNEEFRRLRADFETRASTYPDLRIGVFYVEKDRDPDPSDNFTVPNHVLPLWQFLGEASEIDPVAIHHSDFGVHGAEVSAFALIEGAEVHTFVRMAARAGSLITAQQAQVLSVAVTANVCRIFECEKPVLSTNSNPVAIWLNLILTAVSTFQPERFRQRYLAVDPYTASLAAFDHISHPSISGAYRSAQISR